MKDILVINGDDEFKNYDYDVEEVIVNNYTLDEDLFNNISSINRVIFNNCEVLYSIRDYIDSFNPLYLVLNNIYNFNIELLNNKSFNYLYINNINITKDFIIDTDTLCIYNSKIEDISFINNCKFNKLIIEDQIYNKYKEYLKDFNVIVKSIYEEDYE